MFQKCDVTLFALFFSSFIKVKGVFLDISVMLHAHNSNICSQNVIS